MKTILQTEIGNFIIIWDKKSSVYNEIRLLDY